MIAILCCLWTFSLRLSSTAVFSLIVLSCTQAESHALPLYWYNIQAYWYRIMTLHHTGLIYLCVSTTALL